MKKVPFYGNREDNLHCAVAIYRMLFDYFLDRKISWEDMEKMSGFKPGKAAWTVTIWERMSKQGFDIRMIEPFDYARYEKEGKPYLQTYLSKAEYEWQTKNSNILEIRQYISSFLEVQTVEHRRATLQDVDDMLNDGRLVFMTLNSKILNDKPGFASHAVLVIDKDDDNYIMHDPGLPPAPYRRVSAEKLWQAMGAEQTTSEVTGIKFRPRPLRADQVLANQYPLYSRAALAKLFEKGLVKHDGKTLKPGARVLSNVVLDADLSSLQVSDKTIDLPVLYEDDNILVINKPAGVLAHTQGAFNPEATVATFLRKHVTELTGERAGIVHRLDRPTSGVMVCAKNPKAMAFLQKQFADRTVQKTYGAIVEGHLKQLEAVIDMPIERNPKAPATFRVGPNGKSATTHYKVIEQNDHASLLELKPKTGRTHQLRVHLHQLGHPIIGDPLYGKGKYGDRLYLHAHTLEIVLPETGERKIFTAPLPTEFSDYMEH
ncbi:MAG TPA: RluA family pseudouridine synthase [Candidatus Saccharimonadales bacterium]